MATCRYCKESVHDEAVRCKHCGSEIGVSTPSSSSNKVTYVFDEGLIKFGKFAISLIIIFCIIGVSFYGIDFEHAADEIRNSLKETQKDRFDIMTLVNSLDGVRKEVLDQKKETSNLLEQMRVLASEAEEKVGFVEQEAEHFAQLKDDVSNQAEIAKENVEKGQEILSSAQRKMEEIKNQANSMEGMERKAKQSIAEIERNVEFMRGQVSTVEKIVATLAKRSQLSAQETESLSERVLTEFFSSYRDAVVTVKPLARVWGSGVLVSPNGHIITTDYFIPGGKSQTKVILYDGTVVRPEDILPDFALGLVVIKIKVNKPTNFLPLSKETPSEGTNVVAIGVDRNRSLASLEGQVIKASNETLEVKFPEIYEGFSGAPILNSQGQVLGIIYKEGLESGIQICIPSNKIETFLKEKGLKSLISFRGESTHKVLAAFSDPPRH